MQLQIAREIHVKCRRRVVGRADTYLIDMHASNVRPTRCS